MQDGLKFSARIRKEGILRVVDVPAEISEALGGGKYIFVFAYISGQKFKSTLLPRGKSRHKLFINTEMRKLTGLDTGDEIEIILVFDPDSRQPEIPEYLQEVLDFFPEFDSGFTSLTFSKQQEIIDWLNDAKKIETRQRRIETLMLRLKSGRI